MAAVFSAAGASLTPWGLQGGTSEDGYRASTRVLSILRAHPTGCRPPTLHHAKPRQLLLGRGGGLASAQGQAAACSLVGKRAIPEVAPPTWFWGFLVLMVSAEGLFNLSTGDLVGHGHPGGLATLELQILLLQQALGLPLSLQLLQAPLLLLLLGGWGSQEWIPPYRHRAWVFISTNVD